jgi:hypothetical protein
MVRFCIEEPDETREKEREGERELRARQQAER